MVTRLLNVFDNGDGTTTFYCGEHPTTAFKTVATVGKSDHTSIIDSFWTTHILTLHTDVTAATNQYVLNPGFETYTTSPGAPDSWTDNSGGDATITKDTTAAQVHSGSNSVKIVAGATPTATEGITQDLGVLDPGDYVASVWQRTSAGAGATAQMAIYDNTAAALVAGTTQNGTAGTTTYAKLSAQFTAIAGHDYSMRLQHKPTATTADAIEFDDASVVKTTA